MPAAHPGLTGVRRSGGSGDVRHGNLTQILRYVRDHGPSSRHDIALGCGLGISTMTDLVGELRSRRLMRELDPVRRPGAGRPTRPIALDGLPWCVIGIHLDVDQVQFQAATVGGQELWRDSEDVDLRRTGSEAGFATLDRLLRVQLARVPADKELVAIEVGLPGYILQDRGTVGESYELGWHDFPLDTQISKTLTDLGLAHVHVGVTNDCQLAALHAGRVELGLPADSLAAYLGGSRQFSSALLLDGEIFRGGAGDLTHRNVDPAGPEHWCGRRGCLESLAGPWRLLTRSGLRSSAEARRLVDERPREALGVLAEAASSRHPGLLAALTEAGDALGLVIDDVMGMLNPQTVILGGYLGMLSEHLLPPIEARIANRIGIAAFSTTVTPLPLFQPRAVAGATLAARDVCLYDPLTLTRPLPA